MNQAHYHLVLNHLPILGVLIGMIILAGGFLFKSSAIKRTALVIFIGVCILAVPAFLTGSGAEEVVEELPGVTENIIEEHEEMAVVFIWITSTLGIISLLTLYLDIQQKNLSFTFYLLTAILCVVTMVIAQQVSTLGGKIRHTEIRIPPR